MKSTFYGAILALALSVSAAPVARNSTTSHSSPSHGSHTDDDHFGPPMFFGDEGSDQEPAGSKDPGSSPSANRHHGPWNATTTSTNPILSTGTSTPDINKRSIPSDHEDDHFGPPMFFGDEGSDQEPPGSRDPGSSPSASRHMGQHGNWNATNTDPNPALSTGTSTPDIDINKRNLPSRAVTPNFKSFVSKDGHTMYGMQNAVCSDVTLIFARGTTEKGNMGTCIGPGLAEHLRDEIPSLSVQGVDYPANSKGNTHYGASGGPYMAMLAREARKQCPDTKIVLAGYSQGARVIHGALGHVDEPIDASDVAAVVAFGDPLNGKDELEGVDDDDLLQVCATEDHRCQKGRVDMKPDGGHISYGQSAEDVAKWIKKTVGK